MRRLWSVVAACAACGCNAILGVHDFTTSGGSGSNKSDAGTTDGLVDMQDGAISDAFDPSHDEDGDGVADLVDDCPNVLDSDQTDTDHDGVGDACDPNPNDPIDHRAFFDAFEGPLSAGYQQSSGTWSTSGDKLHVSIPPEGQGALEVPTGDLTRATVTLVIASRTSSTDSTGVGFSIGALSPMVCELEAAGTPAVPTTLSIIVGRSQASGNQPAPSLPFRLIGTTLPTPACRVGTFEEKISTGDVPDSGGLQLATTDPTAQFASVFVVTTD